MSAEERQALRIAIDQAARARLRALLAEIGSGRTCSGCDMPTEEWTPGCLPCWDRHRSMYRRGTHPLGPEGYLRLRESVRITVNHSAATVERCSAAIRASWPLRRARILGHAT